MISALPVMAEIGKPPPRLLAIVMTSLPVAHWFGEPYLRGGFFRDYAQCSLWVRRV